MDVECFFLLQALLAVLFAEPYGVQRADALVLRGRREYEEQSMLAVMMT